MAWELFNEEKGIFMKFIKGTITAFLILILMSFGMRDLLPPLNQKVVSYIDTVIGKKVDRGECWDLAAAALDHAGAYLDRSTQKSIYIFGNKIDPKKETIYAGDIIQFEDIQMEYKKGNAIYKESMGHHTAIIYQVLGEGHYKLAHQNTSFSGKKVGISELKLENVKKGKMIFYRPITKK